MPEGRAPISSSRVSTGDIARHSFAIVRRGFDSDEVRTYLQSVARIIDGLEQREEELRAAIAEADERAAHPVVDEATLTASLGQHSAQILRHAHEEAARIVIQAQEGASTMLREAQSQVDELQASTEASAAERVAEAELMVGTAEAEARTEGERIRAEATAEGEQILARAKEEGRALLEQVQEARRRVLADLSAKRKTLSVQIEQLRAARDEMAATVHGVRDSVDGILQQLQRTDEEARAAALAAGDQARLHAAGDEPYDEDAAPAGGGGATDAAGDQDSRGAGGAGPAEGQGGNPAPSVDELFARIRAGGAVPEGEGAPATEAPEAPAGGSPDAPPAPPTAKAKAGVAVEAEAEVGVGGAVAVAVAEDEHGPDHDLIVRRDELVSPVATQLSRQIKRALGDDQNRMLEALRTAPAASGEALLGTEEAHLALFAAAARAQLEKAYLAGGEFVGNAADQPPGQDAVEQSAAGLARTVVSMLRRRIAEGGDNGEDTAERVGAAFRQWRGERIERLVGDFVLQAFSAGVSAAASPSGRVRWVLTSTSGCSDCDDNALAGPVTLSEGFPTGHPYPPAHSGCRCLVATAPA